MTKSSERREQVGISAAGHLRAIPAHYRRSASRSGWLLTPLLAFGLSRFLVFTAGLLGDTFLVTEPGHWVADPNSQFLSLWAKWDSQWYIQIARDGYWFRPLQQSNVAFFPLYPGLVRLLGPVLGDNLVLAGFVVSNLAFLLGLIFVYRLAELTLEDPTRPGESTGRRGAERTVFYLAFFPTAFFFSAVYTESLFFMLSVATAYLAHRRHWALATTTGLLAAATRNLGIALWGLVMWEWMRSHGWQLGRIHRMETWRQLWRGVRANWADLIVIGAIPLGLIIYMAFLQLNFARPLAFVEVQAAWGRDNIGPHAVLLRELTAVSNLTINKSNLSRALNLSGFLLVLATVPFIWRRMGEGYALYVLIFALLPASSALQSMIRYVLPLFPIFIVLGWWGERPLVDRVLLTTFALLLGVLTAIYANWVFVA